MWQESDNILQIQPNSKQSPLPCHFFTAAAVFILSLSFSINMVVACLYYSALGNRWSSARLVIGKVPNPAISVRWAKCYRVSQCPIMRRLRYANRPKQKQKKKKNSIIPDAPFSMEQNIQYRCLYRLGEMVKILKYWPFTARFQATKIAPDSNATILYSKKP